nr:hypothetical protein [Tanacetum cinerariifolium]
MNLYHSPLTPNDLNDLIIKYKIPRDLHPRLPLEDFVMSELPGNPVENKENVKSRSYKGYHAAPPPYTGNYIPPKPDLMFMDEHVECEYVNVVSNVTSSAVKTVESVDVKNKDVYNTIETIPVKKNNFSPPIIEDWISDDESEVELKPKVEDKTFRLSIEKIKNFKPASEKVEKASSAVVVQWKHFLFKHFLRVSRQGRTQSAALDKNLFKDPICFSLITYFSCCGPMNRSIGPRIPLSMYSYISGIQVPVASSTIVFTLAISTDRSLSSSTNTPFVNPSHCTAASLLKASVFLFTLGIVSSYLTTLVCAGLSSAIVSARKSANTCPFIAFPGIYQQQTPTLPTTAPSTLLQDLPNFGSLFGFDHRLKTLEANFSEFMQMNQFAGAVSSIPGIAQADNDKFLKTINENMQKIIKEQVKEQVKTSYDVPADLSEMELKKILFKKMEGNKSIHRSNEQRNLYKALVEAYESDKIILDTYGDTVTLKSRHDDDADKDEKPFAGSDRGSKRRKEGNEPESARAPKEKATRSTGKSTKGSKSRQTSASESAAAEEPMQTTFEMEEPSHPEFETGADDQPIVQSPQHPEWFSQQKKPPTPDRDWNKTLPATHGSIQPWISELVKQSESRSSFNDLMDTPMDFSNFLMDRLKVDTLTPKLLAGPTYKLMKGSCKSLMELEFLLEEVYKATSDQLDWVNPKGASSHKYTTSVTKTKASDYGIVIQRRVEDLQLGIESYQKKLNLTKPDTYRSDLKRKEAYISYSNPRGFIYQNKDKQNRLMRIDELHKFSDGTLTDVRTALDDRLKGIWMKYLPQSIWRKSNKDRAAAMI